MLRLDRLRSAGSSEVIALPVIAAQGPQGVELGRALDALGDGGCPEGTGELNGPGHRGGALVIRVDRADEGQVDLDVVDREVLKVSK
jgi:hypothetical protein